MKEPYISKSRVYTVDKPKTNRPKPNSNRGGIMGQPGCYDKPDRGFCGISEDKPTEILKCKGCFLTDCKRHGESGFCVMIGNGKGSGYIKKQGVE